MAKHNLASPGIPCDPISDLRVSNAGFVNCMSGGFTGSVHSQCDGGFVTNYPQRTITINGTPYGPYHAGAPMPSSIGITFGGTPVTFNIGGDIINPTITVDPGTPYLGVIPIESLLEAQNTCGDIKTATASFNFVATPPTAAITAIHGTGPAGSEQDATWTLNGGNSTTGCCPTGAALTYLWEVFQADGVTPASLGIHYEIISGTTASQKIILKLLSPGVNFVVKLTVDNGCSTDSTTTTINSQAVPIVGAGIVTTNGRAVAIGNDGSTFGAVNIESNALWKYSMVATVLKDDGSDFGELFRFTDVAALATFTPDFSNSFVTNATTQAEIAAAITNKTVRPTSAGGFIMDDLVAYKAMTGGGAAKTCYFDHGLNMRIKYHWTKVTDGTETSTNTNAIVTDIERYLPGYISGAVSIGFDTPSGDYYSCYGSGEYHRIRQASAGKWDFREIRDVLGVGQEIGTPYIDQINRVNGAPTIYYCDTENSPTKFFKGEKNTTANCINARDEWTWTELLSGTIPASNQDDPLWTYPDGSKYRKAAGQKTFFLGGPFASIWHFIYENPAGTWNYASINWNVSTPASGSPPSAASSTHAGFNLDPSTDILYFHAGQGTFRCWLNDPVNDDPTVAGNWNFEYLQTENGNGSTRGDGTITQFSTPRGLFVDHLNTVNGEPTIFLADRNNHYIVKAVANTVSPTGAADWTWSNFAGDGTIGPAVGTPGKLARPIIRSGAKNSDGNVLVSNTLSSGFPGRSYMMLLNPTTGELTTLIPFNDARNTDNESEFY